MYTIKNVWEQYVVPPVISPMQTLPICKNYAHACDYRMHIIFAYRKGLATLLRTCVKYMYMCTVIVSPDAKISV